MLKIAWSPIYNHPLPENHRFPMIKYDLIPEQLIYEGTVSTSNFFQPESLEDSIILRTHDPTYLQKLRNLQLTRSEERKTGFPLTAKLVEREVVIMNGSLQCALFAKEHGVSMNIAGGTHHAFKDRGEGFCLLNDQAITANYLLDEGIAQRVLIIDLDVHQGNGTASIFEKEPRVFTFSMHGGANYPLHKETSDLDVPLEDGTTDEVYLRLLDHHLSEIVDRFQPDFILYQCGVDVLQSDKLGRLKLTIEGCRKRDERVLSLCKRNDIPVMASMGGGYSSKLSEIINAHANTFRLAQELYF